MSIDMCFSDALLFACFFFALETNSTSADENYAISRKWDLTIRCIEFMPRESFVSERSKMKYRKPFS